MPIDGITECTRGAPAGCRAAGPWWSDRGGRGAGVRRRAPRGAGPGGDRGRGRRRRGSCGRPGAAVTCRAARPGPRRAARRWWRARRRRRRSPTPARSVSRPPASATIGTERGQVPRVRHRVDRHVEHPLGHQAVLPEVAERPGLPAPRRPARASGPGRPAGRTSRRSVVDRYASPSSATPGHRDPPRRRARRVRRSTRPAPRAPHHRRPSAGALTTPDRRARRRTVSAISVAHAGMPREKFFVPSIGSSTQPRPVVGTLAAALLAEHRVARAARRRSARAARPRRRCRRR